jgi:hypothetical protein
MVVISGFAQIAGIAAFIYTMWSRIRGVGSPSREARGERFDDCDKRASLAQVVALRFDEKNSHRTLLPVTEPVIHKRKFARNLTG